MTISQNKISSILHNNLFVLINKFQTLYYGLASNIHLNWSKDLLKMMKKIMKTAPKELFVIRSVKRFQIVSDNTLINDFMVSAIYCLFPVIYISCSIIFHILNQCQLNEINCYDKTINLVLGVEKLRSKIESFTKIESINVTLFIYFIVFIYIILSLFFLEFLRNRLKSGRMKIAKHCNDEPKTTFFSILIFTFITVMIGYLLKFYYYLVFGWVLW